MLAVLCGRVKYSGEGCQECAHLNARGDHAGRKKMAEMSEAAAQAPSTTVRLARSASPLGTAPNVKFHDEAFP